MLWTHGKIDPGPLVSGDDALARRIVRDDGTDESHRYFSSQWQVLEERAGLTTQQYVWSPVYVDAMVLRDRDTDADGDLTDAGGSERLYVQHDANFNVTAIADAAGAVVERYLYDAYGVSTVLDADWTADLDGVSDVIWQHLHQGGRLDVVTGLYHFRYRDYDPVLMRWTRQDPAGFVDTANVFTYLLSNPALGNDPMGLFTLADGAKKYCTDALKGLRRMMSPTEMADAIAACEANATECQAYDGWVKLERARGTGWTTGLPTCPPILPKKDVTVPDGMGHCVTVKEWDLPPGWSGDLGTLAGYHPDATICMRSATIASGARQQCCYRDDGSLIEGGRSAGTPDLKGNTYREHIEHDVDPYDAAVKCRRIGDYLDVRPPM